MDDVEAIERATLAAVPPQACEEAAGWLLPFDDGTVGRAHSAAPLRHAPDVGDAADRIAQRYRERGLRPVFRVADVPPLQGLQAHLAASGYAGGKPTLVQAAAIADLIATAGTTEVRIRATADDDWAGVFLGEGFDVVDGASRVAILRRASSSVYAAIADAGQVVAVGSACFSHGWCGIHGMRTAATHRGRGYAGAILAAFAREARSRGVARVFLQVEEGNTAARSLYARAGFATRWRYRYWQQA
jgi:ribosomal protein S18 acetylase RimI-like enzyme